MTAFRDQIEDLKAQYANLGNARAEIESVQNEAATAAGALAEVEQEVRKKREERDQLSKELDPQHLQARRDELARLKEERQGLSEGLDQLRAERDNALRVMAEARLFETQKPLLEQQIALLQEQLADLKNEVKRDAPVLEQLENAKAELRQCRREMDAAQSESAALIEQKRVLEGALSALGDEVKKLADRKIDLAAEVSKMDEGLGERRNESTYLFGEVKRLKTESQELQEQVAVLLSRRDALKGTAGSDDVPTEEEAILADLTVLPACIRAKSVRANPLSEVDALSRVADYLSKSGLAFDPRVVRAMHTALKINDNAQLTILAGVSGTGKSLLPRRYAEAMGIHFLQISVEPRWDSPQDLLGFYNYVEKRYRATDLARLLVHMDPFESVPLPEGVGTPRHDQVALVLLDEMNLARVEYYFSEFLSRLEARPRFAEAADPRKRLNAMIPIDVRGLKKSLSLYPAHNVLFAGTMNDDESTQALSDKVLDRGNVMQFAAPKEFTDTSSERPPSVPDEALSLKNWRNWVRGAESLPVRDRETTDKVIRRLAVIMEKCGRPFGHRLRDSMIAYAANYPPRDGTPADVRVPLEDQIEFRILPRLRGLEIERHRSAFDDLATLIRTDLNGSEFSQRISELIDEQESRSGLFVWRGLTRSS